MNTWMRSLLLLLLLQPGQSTNHLTIISLVRVITRDTNTQVSTVTSFQVTALVSKAIILNLDITTNREPRTQDHSTTGARVQRGRVLSSWRRSPDCWREQRTLRLTSPSRAVSGQLCSGVSTTTPRPSSTLSLEDITHITTAVDLHSESRSQFRGLSAN